MAPPPSTQKAQCQAIWRKALYEPVILYFQDRKQMERARFTLYDALKPPLQDAELATCKELVEVQSDKANHTLLIQLKSLNPFHDVFAGQLEKISGISGDSSSNPMKADRALEAEESLKRFNSMLGEEGKSGKQEAGREKLSNPYFNREEK